MEIESLLLSRWKVSIDDILDLCSSLGQRGSSSRCEAFSDRIPSPPLLRSSQGGDSVDELLALGKTWWNVAPMGYSVGGLVEWPLARMRLRCKK